MKKSPKFIVSSPPDHLCPWGIKALDLLKRNGFDVTDHRLGSSDDLREHLGLGPDPPWLMIKLPSPSGRWASVDVRVQNLAGTGQGIVQRCAEIFTPDELDKVGFAQHL